jgi:hypothetical protein
LNKDPTGWLLEKNNPSVRYYTLTEIFDKSENNQQVKITKNEIMKKGPVLKILDKQSKEGYWESPRKSLHSQIQRDSLANNNPSRSRC